MLSNIRRQFANLLNRNSYQNKIRNELHFYKDCHNVHELPDIFHYWSNTYLLPKLTPFGFSSPDDFFTVYCKNHCLANPNKTIQIISIGSGNGELEVNIASTLSQSGITNFSLTCMDINRNMLARTKSLADEKGIAQYITMQQQDFNLWQPDSAYDLIIANQSLHHVLALEHLFDAIHAGLTDTGLFLTSDMIGRNGHMRWPEASDALAPFWDTLPNTPYKINRMLRKRQFLHMLQGKKYHYINHNCANQGFEGVRAQDILPLLVARFNFELFLPFSNIIMCFIDRPYGHNFDINNPQDLNFIDRVHTNDEALMLDGTLKPTQMLAAMTKADVAHTKLTHPTLTPEFCIRKIA